MYDTILFDFDGTVFDTVEGISKSARYAINRLGLDAPLEELRCFAGPPLVPMFQEKFGFDYEKAVEATRLFRERYKVQGLHESRPFPGMKELLEELRRIGKKTGIATIKQQLLAEQLLEEAGMRVLFDVICGSPLTKSLTKRELAEQAMAQLGSDPARTVLVGDTRYDAEGAKEAGIAFIGAGYGYAVPGELAAAGARQIADSVEELAALLLG